MRLLIFLAIVYLVYRIVKSWMLKNLPSSDDAVSSPTAGEIDDVMVKDPYCEVYFPKRKGIHLKVDGEDLYFCSPECKGKYLEASSKK